jgi:peptide/nickel transport system permease protein
VRLALVVVVLAVLGYATWRGLRAIRGSRGARKFRRNRLAMAATAVIALYLLVGLSVYVGLISRADTEERVAYRSLPGFGLSPSPEDRFEALRFEVRVVKRAAEAKNPEQALGDIAFGERRPADVPVTELLGRIEAAEALFAELNRSPNLDDDEAMAGKLDEAEAAVDRLFEPLGVWGGFKQGLLLMLGTDRQGRSIAARAFYAIKIAIQIGLVASLFSVIFGGLLGAAAAFFGSWVDNLVQWLYTTLSSIPSLVLLGVLIFAFTGTSYEQTLIPVYAAFCMTFWIGPCRVVRGEALRLKELDYVQAAQSLGAGRWRILFKHVLPNTSHLIFINFSLLFIGAIKSEVILTFLGLGVKNEPSWGVMIDQSKQEVVNDFFWQIGSATALMFGLVLAFNIFTDALQDALDPKHIA